MSAEAADTRPNQALARLLSSAARHPLLTAEEERELALDIEGGLYAGRLLEDGTPRSAQDTEDLRQLRAAGEAAFERFVLSNLRLVVSIARRHEGRGMDLDDLVQEGMFGLIRAVKGFDYAHGLKFSTYATWWIRQAVSRGLADRGRLVRIPVHVEEQVSTMRRAELEFAVREGRTGSAAEIAAELHVDTSQVVQFRRYVASPVPLDLYVSDGAGGFETLAEALSDEEDPLPFDMAAAQDLKVRARQVLDTLPRRDAEILAYRFGLMTGEPMILEDVAKVYGLTRERIRQIEVKSLARLREPDAVGALLGIFDSHPAPDEPAAPEAPAPVQAAAVLRKPSRQRRHAPVARSRPDLKGQARRTATLGALAAFVAREGHARVPAKHAEDGIMLGSWINAQRTLLRKGALGADRIAQMDAIHPTWRSGRTPPGRTAARGPGPGSRHGRPARRRLTQRRPPTRPPLRMFQGMGNSSKDKGDKFEREAVTVLVDQLPEFALPKAMRWLGAGRKEDVGDLYVLGDAAVQVKAWKEMGAGIRAAASGAVIQAGHGDKRFALGMVPILRARSHQVRWLACVAPGQWPVPVEPVAEFALVSRALAWVRADEAPYGFRAWDRLERVGLLAGPGEPALIAPIEAWAAAYRQAQGTELGLAA